MAKKATGKKGSRQTKANTQAKAATAMPVGIKKNTTKTGAEPVRRSTRIKKKVEESLNFGLLDITTPATTTTAAQGGRKRNASTVNETSKPVKATSSKRISRSTKQTATEKYRRNAKAKKEKLVADHFDDPEKILKAARAEARKAKKVGKGKMIAQAQNAQHQDSPTANHAGDAQMLDAIDFEGQSTQAKGPIFNTGPNSTQGTVTTGEDGAQQTSSRPASSPFDPNSTSTPRLNDIHGGHPSPTRDGPAISSSASRKRARASFDNGDEAKSIADHRIKKTRVEAPAPAEDPNSRYQSRSIKDAEKEIPADTNLPLQHKDDDPAVEEKVTVPPTSPNKHQPVSSMEQFIATPKNPRIFTLIAQSAHGETPGGSPSHDTTIGDLGDTTIGNMDDSMMSAYAQRVIDRGLVGQREARAFMPTGELVEVGNDGQSNEHSQMARGSGKRSVGIMPPPVQGQGVATTQQPATYTGPPYSWKPPVSAHRYGIATPKHDPPAAMAHPPASATLAPATPAAAENVHDSLFEGNTPSFHITEEEYARVLGRPPPSQENPDLPADDDEL